MAPKQPVKPEKPDDETDVQRLERLVDAEEVRLATESSATKRNTVMRTVVMLLGELRKARKDERRNGDELDEARVLEWFLRMEPTKQGRFLRELQQRSKKGSGLA